MADNGVGLPAGFALGHTSSLGLRLFENLARYINGILSIRAVVPGTQFTMDFCLLGATK